MKVGFNHPAYSLPPLCFFPYRELFNRGKIYACQSMGNKWLVLIWVHPNAGEVKRCDSVKTCYDRKSRHCLLKTYLYHHRANQGVLLRTSTHTHLVLLSRCKSLEIRQSSWLITTWSLYQESPLQQNLRVVPCMCCANWIHCNCWALAHTKRMAMLLVVPLGLPCKWIRHTLTSHLNIMHCILDNANNNMPSTYGQSAKVKNEHDLYIRSGRQIAVKSLCNW